MRQAGHLGFFQSFSLFSSCQCHLPCFVGTLLLLPISFLRYFLFHWLFAFCLIPVPPRHTPPLALAFLFFYSFFLSSQIPDNLLSFLILFLFLLLLLLLPSTCPTNTPPFNKTLILAFNGLMGRSLPLEITFFLGFIL
ncbi:LOW QUALITY PROTEIN: hypothetical protein TorRG33x02_202910 [Trema orientale]|uniref:Transmembrane protein n=1 Tax=Trema orientale TaxID=63057 RepID=A0A2P5EEM0_TREOI|nr:LOW QUALITY PROTEIN: hypothetical protein TorRG33x02_202910 [Trema orientale]